MKTIEEKQAIYLDWVNNFLSVDCFAEYYSMTYDEAIHAISQGRVIHEQIAAQSQLDHYRKGIKRNGE